MTDRNPSQGYVKKTTPARRKAYAAMAAAAAQRGLQRDQDDQQGAGENRGEGLG